jgi:hypothetical protein
VVIVIGLLALVMLVLAQIFLGNNQLYYSQTAELNINYSARQALDDIDLYVRQASTVLPSYGSYNTGSNTLILEVQSVGASNQLLPGLYDVVVFEMVNSRLVRYVIPSSSSTRTQVTKELATNITDFRFSYDSGDYSAVKTVSTIITLVESALRDSRAITVNSSSSLRN